jgi:hypothetical protein
MVYPGIILNSITCDDCLLWRIMKLITAVIEASHFKIIFSFPANLIPCLVYGLYTNVKSFHRDLKDKKSTGAA